jgi:hypothetical protein
MFMNDVLILEGDNRNVLHVLTLLVSARKQHSTKACSGMGVPRVIYRYIKEKCVVSYTLGQPLAAKPKG